MGEMRQKKQEQLTFPFAEGSEASRSETEGTEAPRVRRETENPAGSQQLMEEVCERENRRAALKRVRANKGNPGIDGKTVDELPEYLEQHWPAIREQLLSGTYEPKPVLRVEIDKPDGGKRKLGIPTVLDRLIQQAVMQVLQRPHSSGKFGATSTKFRRPCALQLASRISTPAASFGTFLDSASHI